MKILRILSPLCITFTAATLLASCVKAQADTIFSANSLPTGTFTSVTQDGYVLEYGNFGSPVTIIDLGGGKHAWVDGNSSDGFGYPLRLHRTDNASFNVLSLDAANLTNLASTYGVTATPDNYTTTQNFYPSSSVFQTYNPTILTNVTSAYISGIAFGNDNIALNNIRVSTPAPVPEAGSVALLLYMSVTAYAFQRRRKHAQNAA